MKRAVWERIRERHWLNFIVMQTPFLCGNLQRRPKTRRLAPWEDDGWIPAHKIQTSIIRLLHSDQFVLINPHKGAASEAPGNNEDPRPSPRSHQQSSSAPLPAHCGLLLAPEGFRDGQSPTSRVHLKDAVKRNVPISAPRMKYLPKKKTPTMQHPVLFGSLHQSALN